MKPWVKYNTSDVQDEKGRNKAVSSSRSCRHFFPSVAVRYLRQVHVHLVAVEVGVVRRACALVEAKRPPRHDLPAWWWRYVGKRYNSHERIPRAGVSLRGRAHGPDGRRSVEEGWVTFTWWAMMDILCSEGWRLNSTMSSSFMCRSTTSPGCRRHASGEWVYTSK